MKSCNMNELIMRHSTLLILVIKYCLRMSKIPNKYVNYSKIQIHESRGQCNPDKTRKGGACIRKRIATNWAALKKPAHCKNVQGKARP